MGMSFGWDFDFIKNLIDGFTQLIKLISVLLILDFEVNDISLVILFRLPLLSEKIRSVLN
jgi:hypothetical protein